MNRVSYLLILLSNGTIWWYPLWYLGIILVSKHLVRKTANVLFFRLRILWKCGERKDLQKQERCHLGRWRLCRQLQKRKRSFGFLVESLPGQELRSMLTCLNVSTKFAMNFMKLGLTNKSKSFPDTPAFPQKNPQHEKKILLQWKGLCCNEVGISYLQQRALPCKIFTHRPASANACEIFWLKEKDKNKKNDKDNQLVSYLVIFMRGKERKNTLIGNVKNEE